MAEPGDKPWAGHKLSPGESPPETHSTSQGFMALFLESASSGVLLIDEDRRILWVNRLLKDTLGSSKRVMTGKRLGDVLLCSNAVRSRWGCGSGRQCFCCEARKIMLSALADGEERRSRVELSIETKGGLHQLELQMCAAPLELDGDKMAAVVIEDLRPLQRLNLLEPEDGLHGMVGRDPEMLRLFDTVREVGSINVPVLIEGESGTGKEMVARALHQESSRSDRPLVIVNCAALASGLLESEFFGHVKGAFTGATRDKRGRFELAHEGTIFLDEIGELRPELQVKLLRVLQNGTFEKVGGEKTLQVDVRVICATNRNLDREVEGGRFRLDLFYRLCVVRVNVSPLRERRDDIPTLAEYLLSRAAYDLGLTRARITRPVLAVLESYAWPGNVRELDNAMRHALVECGGKPIDLSHLPAPILGETHSSGDPAFDTRPRLTRESLDQALSTANGNKTQAARLLGVSRATLYRHLSNRPRGDA